MGVERWRYAFASVTGTSHLRGNIECQDASLIKIINGLEGKVIVLAVSDGAGSASRSAVGSGIAVSSILEQATAWLEQNKTVSGINREIICEWIQGVREQIADCAGEHAEAMRDYAATLLVALVGPSHAVFAQIGDGALVTSSSGQGWKCVFWPMRGEYANTTYFITDDNVIDTLQYASTAESIDEIAALTDGLEPLVLEYATKQAFQPFFAKIFAPLRASSVFNEDASLSAQLEAYLCSPNVTAKADDDLTLVLATARNDKPDITLARNEDTHVSGSVAAN